MQEIIPQHQQLHNLQQMQRASSNPSSSASPTPMGLSNSNSRPHTSNSSGCTPTDGTGSINSGMGGGSSHNSSGVVVTSNQHEPHQTILVEHQTPSPPDLLEQTNQHQMISPGFVMVNGGAKFKKTSTPLNLNAATLARTGINCASVGAPSPVPSTISSVAGGVSPFQRSGTLPLHHGHHVTNFGGHHHHHPQICQHHHNFHPRAMSCDHSGGSQNQGISYNNIGMGVHGVVGLPTAQPTIKTQGQRPGYVTLPRRPKNASWSAGSGGIVQHHGNIPPYLANQLYATLSRSSSVTPTPSQAGGASDREPIYDGVGPRTSADGSSKLSLSSTMPRPQKKPLPMNGVNGKSLVPILKNHGHSPQPKGSGYGLAHLPPYYAPIQELQDENAPPTPKNARNKSAPNVLEVNSNDNLLDLSTLNGIDKETSRNGSRLHNGIADSSVTTSGSEQTLLEESISAYCEPFGKAVLGSRGPSSISHSNSSKDNLVDSVDDSKNSTLNEMNDVRTRLSNAESELEAIVSQINNDNARLKETSNNNYHNGEISEVTSSGDATNNISNIKNTNIFKAVNQENVNGNSPSKDDEPIASLQNGNDATNGNSIYGGVVLKSTLRRKTPPKNNGSNGLSKPKMSRPIPPPKPKKPITSLKRYQDEGADGSEV